MVYAETGYGCPLTVATCKNFLIQLSVIFADVTDITSFIKYVINLEVAKITFYLKFS